MTTDTPLFPLLLGDAWLQLAAPVRQVHGGIHSITTRGTADVNGANHLPARLLRWLLGLPEPGAGQAVEVRIDRDGPTEVWTRRFASGQMRSVLARSRHGRLCERLGPVALRFELRADADAIEWQLIGASMLGVPLPRLLLGTVSARCAAEDEQYLFAIEASLPLLGVWIGYRGLLVADS